MIDKIFDKGYEFKVVTPEGNTISGLINKKPNSNMGSLLIQEVNGRKTKQYIQGFPKIHYWDGKHRVDNRITCYEKMDGSCVAIYPLYDSDDNLIELVPKSRGMPILDKNLQSMYNLCEKSHIKRYFEVNPYDILYFEMYGIKNLHSIEYMDTYIDLNLIGIYDSIKMDGEGRFLTNSFLDGYDLEIQSQVYGLKQPAKLFEIVDSFNSNEKMVVLKDDFRMKYSNYVQSNKVVYKVPTVYDGILKIREILEEVNKNYNDANGRIITEGVVINGMDGIKQRYIKVKPDTIENECKTINGIPRKFIIKEVYKFFDEYGSDVKDIYLNNPEKIWDYVNEQLSEEFSKDIIENSKTQKRIEKVFLNIADSREVPESINNIANELVSKYPKESISNLMRIFSQEYPYKKKDARLVYSILTKIME